METIVYLARGLSMAVTCAAGTMLAIAACQAQPPAPSADESELRFEGKMVADVRAHWVGNPTIQAGWIMKMLKTRPGKPFSVAIAIGDVRTLIESHSFHDVRYLLEPTTDDKVIVHFQLYEFPGAVCEIVYQGARHFTPKELEEATDLHVGTRMNPLHNRHACRKIAQLYHAKGMRAQVVLLEGTDPGDGRVVFEINEGPEGTRQGGR